LGRYVARRLLQLIPVVLGTTFIIYVAVYALPGDPIQALAGPHQVVAPAVAHALRARYHLDQPLLVQYVYYLTGLLHADFGVDFNGTSVIQIIIASWPITVTLALTAWAFEIIFGLSLGTVAAIRRGELADHTVLAGTTLIMGIPYFVLAYVAQILIGVKLGWFPVSGIEDGWPKSYLLPGFILALISLPSIARLTRASVLENLRADYVDTAIAKGLSYRRVILKHVLRNSLIPVTSLLAIDLGYLLGGTVLIEGIFNLPGLGFQIFTGIQQHDGPVVVGVSTLLVLVFLFVNLVVDLGYGVLDPRIRHV